MAKQFKSERHAALGSSEWQRPSVIRVPRHRPSVNGWALSAALLIVVTTALLVVHFK